MKFQRSWPTAIDDMLEEEKTAGELVSFNFLSLMSARMPLAEVYRIRLRAPSARGVSTVVQGEVSNLADSPHPANFDALYEDFEVENEILRVMMWAQASLVEAILFSDKLNDLLEELEACLDTSEC